jgi:poly-gamma-glutamate synthesis protein (capsule biosynthesis protein)
VPREQVDFAHRLIDGGVDVVHGHSSHHPRPVEVYRDRLVLYGCGDLVDDYEGIAGYERFRPDLRVAWLAALDPSDGRVAELRGTVLQARRMRLERAASPDVGQLAGMLTRAAADLGTVVERAGDGTLLVRPPP